MMVIPRYVAQLPEHLSMFSCEKNNQNEFVMSMQSQSHRVTFNNIAFHLPICFPLS